MKKNTAFRRAFFQCILMLQCFQYCYSQESSIGWYLINESGEKLKEVPVKIAEFGCWGDGAIAFKSDKGKWGLINTTADIVLECKYDEIGVLSSGVAPVLIEKKWQYICVTKGAATSIQGQFDYADSFKHGIAKVSMRANVDFINDRFTDMISWYINNEGNAISDKRDGFYVDQCSSDIVFTESGLFSIKNDKIINELSDIHLLGGFSVDGVAAAQKKASIGLIDSNGTFFEIKGVDGIGSPNNGIITYRLNGKFGYMTYKGVKLTEAKYVFAGKFEGNLAPVYGGNRWSFIDKQGADMKIGDYIATSGFSSQGVAFVRSL
jgi:hypothetical protein